MSEFLRLFKTKVAERIEPRLEFNEETSPAVKVALAMIGIAEEVDAELAARRVGTAEAASLTGWSVETLQRYAKAITEGRAVPQSWKGLVVTKDGHDYLFALGTIPAKKRDAA